MITNDASLRARGLGGGGGYRPGDMVTTNKISLTTKGLKAQTATPAFVSSEAHCMYFSMGDYTYTFLYDTATTPYSYKMKKFNSRTCTLVDTVIFTSAYQRAEVDAASGKMLLYGEPRLTATSTILECTHVAGDAPTIIGTVRTMRSSIRRVKYEHANNLVYVLYYDGVVEVRDTSSPNWDVLATITTPLNPVLTNFGKAYDIVPRGDGSTLFLADEEQSKDNTYCNVAAYNWRTNTQLWTKKYYVAYYGQVELNYWRARDELIMFLAYYDHQSETRYSDLMRVAWNTGTGIGTYRLTSSYYDSQAQAQIDARGIYGTVSNTSSKAWWFNPATNAVVQDSYAPNSPWGVGYVWENNTLYVLSRNGDNLAKYQWEDLYKILS